jgi:hypothetical protein
MGVIYPVYNVSLIIIVTMNLPYNEYILIKKFIKKMDKFL